MPTFERWLVCMVSLFGSHRVSSILIYTSYSSPRYHAEQRPLERTYASFVINRYAIYLEILGKVTYVLNKNSLRRGLRTHIYMYIVI